MIINNSVMQIDRPGAIVECDNCKTGFGLYTVAIHEADVVIGGNNFHLVYFECPVCRTIYRIALFDARFYALRADVIRTRERIRKNHGSNRKEFGVALDAALRRKMDRLRNYVANLNGKYPGTFAYTVPYNGACEGIVYIPPQ